MRRSSASGREVARGLSTVQSVNSLHPDVESRLTIRSETDHLNQAPAPRVTRHEAFSRIVYVSRKMDEFISGIVSAGASSEPMLITGETGTGKELLARAVHAISPYHKGKFIAFNCATATRELFESRLCGHERGAFTGADKPFIGLIRAANGGTFLLDEVGELIPDLQPMLLRILQECEVLSVGATEPVRINVRVIAATNRDLRADFISGQFRADLFYRLNVHSAHIPPLRERPEDIRPLAEHFLGRVQRKYDKHGLWLSDEAWAVMSDHDWPGNAREVENVAYRLVASSGNCEMIGLEGALCAINAGLYASPQGAPVAIGGRSLAALIKLPHHEARDILLRLQIEDALKQAGGNLSQTAETLVMSLHGLKKAINRLGIEARKDGHRWASLMS